MALEEIDEEHPAWMDRVTYRRRRRPQPIYVESPRSSVRVSATTEEWARFGHAVHQVGAHVFGFDPGMNSTLRSLMALFADAAHAIAEDIDRNFPRFPEKGSAPLAREVEYREALERYFAERIRFGVIAKGVRPLRRPLVKQEVASAVREAPRAEGGQPLGTLVPRDRRLGAAGQRSLFQDPGATGGTGNGKS